MEHNTSRTLAEAALKEILDWEQTKRSQQLSNFLRYIVLRALNGDSTSIKAYSIAIDVLGRAEDFDPQTDPIVRVQAARLRALLNQFYDSNLNQVPLRISMPVGRYIPKFEVLSSVPFVETSDKVRGSHSGKSGSGIFSREWYQGQWWHGTAPLLAGALIAIGIVGFLSLWILLSDRDAGIGIGLDPPSLQRPLVHVALIENLTGSKEFDQAIEGFSRLLIADLARFDTLNVEQTATNSVHQIQHGHDSDGSYLIGGVARRTGEEVHIDLVLSLESDLKVFWSQTVQVESADDGVFAESVAAASHEFSTALGSARGPLHLQNRALIAADPYDYGPASDYSCQVLFSLARDEASDLYKEAALSCFDQLLAIDPESVVGNAGWAGMRVESLIDAPFSVRVPKLLFDETRSARMAVQRAPQSEFAHARLAEVLSVQNQTVEALAVYQEALRLNFCNIDNLVKYATLLAFSGDWERGRVKLDKVRPFPNETPAWYHEVLAFDAVRNHNYEAALAHALIVVGENEKMGKILVLSLAPLVGRADLVERYSQDVLTNSNLQSAGLFPWLSRFIADASMLERLEPGLLSAGVPEKAIRGPFDARDF